MVSARRPRGDPRLRPRDDLDPARQSIAAGPIGTVEYMAPEQATGRQVGEAADWYSVGVMLYEALTGKMPHQGHALEIMIAKQQVEPSRRSEIVPDAPRDLSRAVHRAARDRARRGRPTATMIARSSASSSGRPRGPRRRW